MFIHSVKSDLFVFKYPEIMGINVLLYIMLASGIFFGVIEKSLFPFLLSFLAIYYIFSYDAILVNLENKTYSRTRIFINTIIGNKWKELPEIIYVSVFKTIMVSTSHSITYRTIELKEKVVTINLVYNKNSRMQVYQTYDSDEAMEKAKHIAHKLDVKIYDARTHNGVWV